MTELELLDATASDIKLAKAVLRRIAEDLAMVIDRALPLEKIEVSRIAQRAAGRDRVHISFKLEFRHGDRVAHGCVLFPLPDAISLACYLMMVPDDAVRGHRSASDLDRATKDALIEVGNFIGGATDAALRSLVPEGLSVRSNGCQGVRADVRPAFPYEEGSELVLARSRARVAQFDPFEVLLMMPVLDVSLGG